MQNVDFLVSGQNVSGKTVGFGLALGETLLSAQDNFGSAAAQLALIIAPRANWPGYMRPPGL